jgi:hypothetical protein
MDNRLYKIKAELSHILYPKGAQSDETSSKIASFIVTESISQPSELFYIGQK